MDDKKIHSVVNWLQPTTLKELQRFLGFANFYRRFIRNFSTVAAPLTSMTKKGNQRLTWSPAAHQAFRTLKERFTTAPILHHPNPEQEFIVEVDASSTGIGAVLSQHQGDPPKLYPCAFFSRKLNPAEQNYDVGNRELLAMKAAFEEWRHWLKGAKHPFTVLTDHRNLEYLKSTIDRQDGHSSSPDSTSKSLIVQAHKTPRQTHSHDSMNLPPRILVKNSSFHPPSSSHPFSGTS